MSKHEPQFVEEPVEHPDSWHRHTVDEGAPQEEHGAHENPRILAAAFVILTVGFLITVFAVIGFYFVSVERLKSERLETTAMAAPWFHINKTTKEAMTTYRWDTVEGESRILPPLEFAMGRVVDRYRAHGSGR